MSIYAIWNNKGGVGKSYLTFQMAAEYARTHRDQKILVIDLCPQANVSSMLLGGIIQGEANLDQISAAIPRQTISGYIEDRIRNPYTSTGTGSNYVIQASSYNSFLPDNLYLVVGDEQLEIQTSRVSRATIPGVTDAWRQVHTWISDLIMDIRRSWDVVDSTVFIDCNPSFSIYTELAMSASDRLLIPFSADGSSKRAVRAVLSLVYGITRTPGSAQSEYFINTQQFRMSKPRIYGYVGNRLTQGDQKAAVAFKTVVTEIGREIYNVWTTNQNLFHIHPNGHPVPRNQTEFRKMFQVEINDANTASVVSGALGIPMSVLTAGYKNIVGTKPAKVNQAQIEKLRPNLQSFVAQIE